MQITTGQIVLKPSAPTAAFRLGFRTQELVGSSAYNPWVYFQFLCDRGLRVVTGTPANCIVLSEGYHVDPTYTPPLETTRQFGPATVAMATLGSSNNTTRQINSFRAGKGDFVLDPVNYTGGKASVYPADASGTVGFVLEWVFRERFFGATFQTWLRVDSYIGLTPPATLNSSLSVATATNALTGLGVTSIPVVVEWEPAYYGLGSAQCVVSAKVDFTQLGVGSAALTVRLTRRVEAPTITGTIQEVAWTQPDVSTIVLTWNGAGVAGHSFWEVQRVVDGASVGAPIPVAQDRARLELRRDIDWTWPFPHPQTGGAKIKFIVVAKAGSAAGPAVASNEAQAQAPTQMTEPPAVTNLVAVVHGYTRVTLSWTPGAADGDVAWLTSVLYGRTADVGSAVRIDLGLDTQRSSYAIAGLTPGATYTFWVVTTRWGKTAEATVSVTLPQQSTALQPVMGATMSPGARLSTVKLANSIFVFSSRDRAIQVTNRNVYHMGLKPFKDWGATPAKPSVEVVGPGNLVGTFTPFACYHRMTSPGAWSNPVAGDPVTVAENTSAAPGLRGAQIRVKPPLVGGFVPVREWGWDQAGNRIEAADYYELYLQDSHGRRAYHLGTFPIYDQAGVLLPATFSVEDLNNGLVRRPMEMLLENSRPPVCGLVTYWASRLWACGEETVTGEGLLKVTAGSRVISVSGFDNAGRAAVIPEAAYNHELMVMGRASGWFVVDVEGNEALLSHPDPETNKAGWNLEVVGEFTDFRFVGHPSRVYTSGYYTGEAGGGVSWRPQGFPALAQFESEFDPDDGESPQGLVVSRDSLFVLKPSQVFLVTGGAEPTAGDPEIGAVLPLVSAGAISRGSGLLAPRTICRDRNDRVHYLSDQGIHRLTEAGVEQLMLEAGAWWQFQRYYWIESVRTAVAQWFGREDQLVVAGLAKSAGGVPRYGFIYDSRTRRILPFSTPFVVTELKPFKSPRGDTILLYGDTRGNVGVLLARDWYTDGFSFVGDSDEQPVVAYVESTRRPSPGWRTPTRVRPLLDQEPLETGVNMRLEIMGHGRMARTGVWSPDESVEWRTDDVLLDALRVRPVRSASHSVRLWLESSRRERVRLQGIELEEDELG